MRHGSNKKFRDMTPDEQRRHQALLRLRNSNPLHYVLHDAGFVPLYRRMVEEGRPFCIISGNPLENMRRADEDERLLRARLKGMDQAFLPAWGVWTPEEGVERDEMALFLPGIALDTAMDLAKKHGRRTVLYGAGDEYRGWDLKTGGNLGAHKVEPRLRRLVLGKGLEPLPWPQGEAGTWRYTCPEGSDLVIEAFRNRPIEEGLRLGHKGYPSEPRNLLAKGRHFFFWRGRSAWIAMMSQPWGITVHDRMPGSLLSCGYGLDMGQLDTYIPLWPTPETEAEIVRLRKVYGVWAD